MPMFNDRNLDFHYDDLQSMDEWSFKADFVSAMTGGTLLDQPSYTSNHSILMSESDPILPNDTYTQLSSHHPIKSIKSETDYESSMDDWRNKQVDTWNTHDVLYWLAAEAQRLGIPSPEIGIDRFAAAGVDGIRLQSMTEQDFCNLNRLYGNAIYCSLQSHRAESDRSSYQYDNMFQLSIEEPSSNLQQYDTSLPPPLDSHVLTNLDNDTSLSSSSSSESRLAHHKTSYHQHSDNESGSDSGFESERPPEKRKPGRPRGTRRKKKPEKLGRLWEFIRDLLKNREYCPSLICWDNYEEGMFRFVHSDKVAKLWGSKKDNPEMNYEKLSRAMRYYYKSKVLQPVLGRRLVYKFGPTATGWRMENPIFARSN